MLGFYFARLLVPILMSHFGLIVIFTPNVWWLLNLCERESDMLSPLASSFHPGDPILIPISASSCA